MNDCTQPCLECRRTERKKSCIEKFGDTEQAPDTFWGRFKNWLGL